MKQLSKSSMEVAAAALRLATSTSRAEEKELQEQYRALGIQTAAVDFGGDLLNSIQKIIERAVVAAKREQLIGETHAEEGAVAGAAREAVSQLMTKAIGYNVGGKIGVARCEEHVCVATFFAIGLLHLNEVAIGLGHRAL
jgi:hypothetical protein